MALIKCPECGGDVSDQAPACIHCGFPLSEYVEQLKEDVPRYDLYSINNGSSDEELEIEERLFKELLGMPHSDFYYVANRVGRKAIYMIAQGLTGEQVSKIEGACEANGIETKIFIHEHGNDDHIISWSDVAGYTTEYKVKQDHYEQVINAAQKAEIEPPPTYASASSASSASTASTGPKCPTCGSTNVQKINQAGRLVSTAVWGVSSKKMAKTYKCNKCGHTW